MSDILVLVLDNHQLKHLKEIMNHDIENEEPYCETCTKLKIALNNAWSQYLQVRSGGN